MKALIILSLHDHHVSYLFIYMEKMNFCEALCALLEYFHEKTLPRHHCSNIGVHIGIQLSWSNIMKYGESDVEQQISIQVCHFWKREGSFNSLSLQSNVSAFLITCWRFDSEADSLFLLFLLM